MTATALSALFDPKAVAIVGASGNPDSILAKPLAYMQRAGFGGTLYPVNPNRSEIGGLECYPDLSALPGDIDVALIQVPARLVLDSVAGAADRGAKAAILLSAGFAEAGSEGIELQDELTALARDRGIRLLGPNSQGLVYAPSGFVATFTMAGDRADAGGLLAYAGQSGAVGGSVLDLAAEAGCPVGAWAATGNQADLDAVEVAEYIASQGRFRAIMLYLEATPDGTAYRRLLTQAAETDTRLVVLRTGNSEAARRAAESHTGSMLDDAVALRLMSEECGVILVDDIADLVHVAASIPEKPAGKRVGILTTSGGAGILVADACERAGLSVDRFSDPTRNDLAARLPGFASVENPVDVTAQFFNRGDDSDLGKLGLAILESDDVDQLIVAISMATGDVALRLADQIATLYRLASKPVHLVWYVGHERTVDARMRLREDGLVAFDSADRVAQAAAAATARLAAPPTLSKRLAPETLATIGRGRMIEANGGGLITHLGLPVPPSVLVTTATNALAAASDLTEPYVVKLQSLDITHKTEVGGVEMGVTASRLESVVERMLAIEPGEHLGVLIQQTAAQGIELIVAITVDDTYPPVLTIGMGGTGVELYEDVTSRTLPVTRSQVVEMLAELRGAPLLAAFRGGASYDIDGAADMIAEMTQRALGVGLTELEINPLLVHPVGGGVTAVDLLAHIGPLEESGGPDARRSATTPATNGETQ